MSSADPAVTLPASVMAALQQPKADPSPDRLQAFALAICAKRDEAVKHRTASGIEETWVACEEAYAGIDDANRGSVGTSKWMKPLSKEGPLTKETRKDAGNRSTVFVPLTARYVDMGSAKVCEILLPVHDKAFSFEPTPVPLLVQGQKDTTQVMENGLPLSRHARPEEIPPPMPSANGAAPPQGLPPGVPLTVKDLAEEAVEKATDAAKKAEKRIDDQLVESQFPKEIRKVIKDAARIGVGVFKGPFPKRRVRKAMRKGSEGLTLEIIEEITQAGKWVDPWNIFPDPACGENICDGDYLLERDWLSEKQVRDLKQMKGYQGTLIDDVIAEGPGKIHAKENANPASKDENVLHRYDVWYYHGTIKKDDLSLANPDMATKVKHDKDLVHAIATIINDRVVHVTLSPLESGELPYHSFPWRRRSDCWAGVGMAEQLDVPQRIINGAVRAMSNNAGVSAGPQIVMNRNAITPADGVTTITPLKVWYANGDAQDVRTAFVTFDIPNHVNEFMPIIDFALRMAEEATNVPLITQGQVGQTTPDTYGAAKLQDTNANQGLRDIGYGFDDHITEPVIRQFYECLLLDPNVPDEEKGDITINAHGSISLVDRYIENQTIVEMAKMVENPAFGCDPKKWFAEYMKSRHLNPKDFQYTPQEQAKIDAQPKPQDPRIATAQIKAQSDMQIEQLDLTLEKQLAQLDAETTLQKARMDRDRDTMFTKAETDRTVADAHIRIKELHAKTELLLIEYANKRQISLEEVKAKLADTAMKLNVQRELSAKDHAVDLHMHHNPVVTPPTEPSGKAKPGKAYQS